MEKEESVNEPGFREIVGFIAFVVLTWLGLGYYASTLKNPGTFGDMFGAVNALFSGLAFAGLIFTIWQQRIELRLQRQALKATQHELAGQKAQMEAQNRTLRRQNFENTFFQLLRLHNDIVNSIDLVDKDDSNRVTKGRDCFHIFYSRFRRAYKIRPKQEDARQVSVQVQLNEIYMEFYRSHSSELGHYFRSLYNIVKFVKNNEVENKSLYTNLVRAQLSSFELLLIFYNCLSEMGREKFKPLTVEFHLLKHLQSQNLLDPNHASLYS